MGGELRSSWAGPGPDNGAVGFDKDADDDDDDGETKSI